jgi:hypothetical protein
MAAEDFQTSPGQTSPKSEVWERLEQARKIKAAQGGYIGHGSPAFGQQSVNGELIEKLDEQQIIELIRRHHKSGKSLQQVADWLNQNGYKTKRGKQWQRISVKRVLDRLYGRIPRISGTSLPAEQSTESPAKQSTESPIEQSTESPAEQFTESLAESEQNDLSH